jgi:Co/Zn/Cd efflux system component
MPVSIIGFGFDRQPLFLSPLVFGNPRLCARSHDHFARRNAADPHYSFGSGKMGVLGGFASAAVLSLVAILMAGESLYPVFVPSPVHFNEASGIAAPAVGLLANLVCVFCHVVQYLKRHALRE